MNMNTLLVEFARDCKLGLRTMRNAPAFTCFAVLTLGLGIGASTTVFTIVNTLLLNPLPAKDPSSLVAVYTTQSNAGGQASALLPSSYLNLQELGANNSVFSSIGGYTQPLVMTLNGNTEPQRIFGELVTRGFFESLGIHPAKGRFFLPAENTTPGSVNVAVLSYGAWQRKFGAAEDILGRNLAVNGTTFTVIGVTPSGFIGVSAVFGPDVWLPATMAQQVLPAQSKSALTERAMNLFHAVARLKPGITRERALANVQTVAAALGREYPQANEGRAFSVEPITTELFSKAGGERTLKFAGIGLMALVSVILLIACSNIANLLLARASSRRQELSVRLAIGAGPWRIVRQFLTESVLLGLLGGFVGLAIGYEGCQILWTLRPAEVAANMVSPRLDVPVFFFAFIVSLATGLLFGAVPAMRAARTDMLEGLKEETRIAGLGRRGETFANALLVGQVALSLVSLIIAGMFLRAVERAYRIDPGFNARHLALFMMNPEQAGYDRARMKEVYRDLRERLSHLPGVADVSWASNLPFWSSPSRTLLFEGQEQLKKSERPVTIVNTVDLGYFSAMQIPLLEGRDFNENDRDASVPVAVVNEYLAQKYWPGSNAVGRRFRFSDDSVTRQIVGVAKTTNYTGLGERPQTCVYLPLRQNFVEGVTLYVRAAGDPASIMAAVQREVHNIAPAIEVSDARTGAKLISQVLFFQSGGVGILGVFGLLALVLASVGLYGLQAYSVSRRQREIGVRMAMGANRSDVLRLILRQGLTLVAAGIGIGLALSVILGRTLSKMLFGVSPYDPASLAGGTAALVLAALIACYVPARAATRVDPMVGLRAK